MADLNRLPVKWVRDYIKKDYKAKDKCFICGDLKKLELHHVYSLSELFHSWCSDNNIHDITEQEDILKHRVVFAEQCADKLSNDNLYTLCSSHHKQLHSVYGQRYSNNMVPKVIKWLGIQRNKHDTKA